jgi:hypothetical protein
MKTSRIKFCLALVGSVFSLLAIVFLCILIRVRYPPASGLKTTGGPKKSRTQIAGSISSGLPDSGYFPNSPTGVQQVCNSTDLSGCSRGMYVSLYTTVIGQITFSGGDAAIFSNILGNSTKEQYLLNFAAAENITSLSLYNLGTILGNSQLSNNLVSFMTKARSQINISRIEAVGAVSTSVWDNIFAFHQNQSPFDGFVTEIEFWNNATSSPSFNSFISTLQYVRSLSWRNSTSGNKPTLTSYLGWPTAAQVTSMAPYLDRVYLNCYVQNPSTSYSYGLNRFRMFDDANKAQNLSIEIIPIFSAEGVKYSAGSSSYMGDWLQNHSIPQAESTFLSDWTAGSLGNTTKYAGNQYYQYYFLRKHLK